MTLYSHILFNSNSLCKLSGWFVTIVATALTANDPYDISGWRTLFLITVGLYVFAWLLFVVFIKITPLPFDEQSEEKLSKRGEFTEIPESPESPPSYNEIHRKT